jgi:hypothetical protein
MGALDTHDPDLWDSVLTVDAKRYYANHKNSDQLRGFMKKLPAGFYPVHLLTNIVINQTGPDTAEGTGYGIAYNILGKEDDAIPRPMPATPSRIGKTLYKFRKTADGWKICETRIPPAFIDDMKMPHREGEFDD